MTLDARPKYFISATNNLTHVDSFGNIFDNLANVIPEKEKEMD